MQITVKLSDSHQTIDLEDGSDSFNLLKHMGLYPDAVLLFRDGIVLPEDEKISDGDCIEIMKIASGG